MNIKRFFASAGAGALALATIASVAFTYAPGAFPTPIAAVEGTSADTGQEESGAPAPSEEPDLTATRQIGTGEFQVFEATAYCDFGITYSGVPVRRGIVAADPLILPIGSVIEVEAGDYSGIYTVMDTGGVVKGRLIDIFVPDYEEAIQFGRQDVKIRILRRGWHPEAAPDYQYSLAG